jgi:pentatricopeptide repeat protein
MTDTNIDMKLKAHEVLRQMRENNNLESARPNVRSYSTVINGWAQTGNYERASDVLRLMYDDYVKGNTNAKPDVTVYNTILTAYLRSKDKASWNRAAALIEHMKKISNEGVLAIEPDVFSMSTGKCWTLTKI